MTIAVVAPAPVAGQTFRLVPLWQPEVRSELSVSARSALSAGAALNGPAGYYVRIGSGVAVGRELGPRPRNAVRADFTIRFLADPFAESRWGPYAGGGISVDWRDGWSGRPAVVLIVGSDLPKRGGWSPALEAGIGSGVRAAVVFRRVRRSGR